ncbi:hypothetical protein SLS62_008815 [Diatrype stigma]|uniref:Uncharacterized protein n=1 Tax=Diatrype stigma TaxID=117547 RepID=A0AAN9YKA1_9PEZI
MDPSLQPMKSAELPIMPESVKTLVSMIDEGNTMDEIYYTLCKSDMVKSVADPNNWIGGNELRLLFHTLSRQFLRSVLMKTLGPDLHDKSNQEANWERVFHTEGPGCYVCFIHVNGRSGKFLSGTEIQQLISLLRTYAEAVDLYQRLGHDDPYISSQELEGRERAIYLEAMAVDDALRSKPKWTAPDFNSFQPRFASSTKAHMSENISLLISMLKKRCSPDVDADVRQRQSPLLVGSSGSMARRVEDHKNGSLVGSPPIWGLLVSCLRIMLPASFSDGSTHVFVNTPWTLENIQQSLDARQLRADRASARRREMREELIEGIEALESAVEELKNTCKELDEAKAKYKELVKDATAMLARRQG